MSDQKILIMGTSSNPWSELKRAPATAKFGLFIILCYVVTAIFAPLLSAYGEVEIVGQPFEPWSRDFVLGTDIHGRDMLTQLIYGARNTMGIALATACLAFLIGAISGIVAVILDGWTDQILSRIVDVLMAIPQLIFAMLLLAILGTKIGTLIFVIAVLDSTRVFRLTRSASLNLMARDFVEAARLRGEGRLWLSIREILPNISSLMIAEFGTRFCAILLTIAALSFLGLGPQPPIADWGSMARDSASQIVSGDITALLPAVAIALLAVAVNFLVDWFLHRSGNLKRPAPIIVNKETNSEASGDEILLEIRNLHIDGKTDDGWHDIIKGIDITLKRGEVLGLIGESGAGKSTAGLAAMCFARPGCRIKSGSIKFDGQELAELSEDERRKLRGVRIAYVAQSAAASFNPSLKLIDQFSEIPVEHGVCNRVKAEEDAKDLYRRILLPDPDGIGYRYPHQVSGGQLQCAMTAMALSCRPDLIIFDEPTTALDATTQIEVLATIRDIVREFNTAAIYISHDLAVVAQMADNIMVLRQGELVERAETREMLRNPQQDYTKSLWAVRSFIREVAPSEPGPAPLISVDRVTATYGQQTVLHDISFEIHRGQTVALVGESGCGKSTAARVITGLLPPIMGEVLFDGVALPADYRNRNKDQLRHAQMTYQIAETALNPRQRIRDIIGRPLSFYLGLKGQAKENRIREILSLIELEPSQYIDRYPRELSSGQIQRIGIARALAAEPEFIICDEVTSALDQLVAEGILRLLDRLQREFNLAYMYISHDLTTVRAIADHVIVMLQGKIVEQGLKQEIYTPPHHKYTELLLSSAPEMDPDWLDNLLKQRAENELEKSAG